MNDKTYHIVWCCVSVVQWGRCHLANHWLFRRLGPSWWTMQQAFLKAVGKPLVHWMRSSLSSCPSPSHPRIWKIWCLSDLLVWFWFVFADLLFLNNFFSYQLCCFGWYVYDSLFSYLCLNVYSSKNVGWWDLSQETNYVCSFSFVIIYFYKIFCCRFTTWLINNKNEQSK